MHCKLFPSIRCHCGGHKTDLTHISRSKSALATALASYCSSQLLSEGIESVWSWKRQFEKIAKRLVEPISRNAVCASLLSVCLCVCVSVCAIKGQPLTGRQHNGNKLDGVGPVDKRPSTD